MILSCPTCPWLSDDVDNVQQFYDHIKNVHSDQNNEQIEDLDTGQILR